MQETGITRGERRYSADSVAIIMDGNGRWARRRGLPRSAGHAEGIRNIERTLGVLRENGVRYATLYAFSTENWKRPAEEISGLMSLAESYLRARIIPRLADPEYDIALRFIGDRAPLSPELSSVMEEAERISEGRAFVCNVAFNYGGRSEIVRAANAAFSDGNARLTEEILSRYLYTAGTPDPDLIIRTGGELRLSNFLLWQAAYSELYVTDTLWPDFCREDIEAALGSFSTRKRRFGGITPEEEKEVSDKDK